MRAKKKEYARQKRINSSIRIIRCPACRKEYEKSKDVVNYSFKCIRCGNEIHIDESGKISAVANSQTSNASAFDQASDNQKDKKENDHRSDFGPKEKKEIKNSKINTSDSAFDFKKWIFAGIGVICVGVLYGNRKL